MIDFTEIATSGYTDKSKSCEVMNYVLNLYAKLSAQVVEDGNGTLISCHNPSHSLTMVQELLHHDWPLKTPTVLQFKPFYSNQKKKKSIFW